jgi:hypothetical protein
VIAKKNDPGCFNAINAIPFKAGAYKERTGLMQELRSDGLDLWRRKRKTIWKRRETISTRLWRSPGSAWPRLRRDLPTRRVSCGAVFDRRADGQDRQDAFRGSRAAFARLAKETSGDGPAFSTFLAQAYLYKEIADYGVGSGAELTMAEAYDAIAMAERFVGWAATALE